MIRLINSRCSLSAGLIMEMRNQTESVLENGHSSVLGLMRRYRERESECRSNNRAGGSMSE